MFILNMNPMTGRAENCTPVARAETKEALLAFIESEKVEPYQDGPWSKCFRRGGPLEWFNPPDCQLFPAFVDVGTLEDWKRRAEAEWQSMCSQVPGV